MSNQKNNFAFTLAEVLITLGIIGVVAALTIPALINKTNEREMKSAWKKNFSVISQAFERVKQDEGGDVAAYFDAAWGTAPLVILLGNYLSYSEFCGSGAYNTTNAVCGTIPSTWVGQYYKTLSGQYIDENNLGCGQYILKDGTQLFFRTYNTGYFTVWVDVNGARKKPNTAGKDLFGMLISKDKIIPFGVAGSGVDIENGCKEAAYPTCPNASHCAGDFAGIGCSAKYLYE